MNCCDRILLFFLAFSFFQYSIRWQSDSEVASAPWQVYIMAKGNKTEPKSSTDLTFHKRAVAYGTATTKVASTHLYSTDRQEIFILVNAKIVGPAMSFHRVQVTVNDKPVRELSLFTSPLGEAHGSLYLSMIHLPSSHLKIKHIFDDIWNMDEKATASVHMVIRSGYSSLWDVKWSAVYKQ